MNRIRGSGRLYPEGFTPQRYRDAVLETMEALKAAFPTSVEMVYANFMNGEWLPHNDRGYLQSVYERAWELGVAVPDADAKGTAQPQPALHRRVAREQLAVRYVFWSTQEPYFSEELIPLLSSEPAIQTQEWRVFSASVRCDESPQLLERGSQVQQGFQE